MLSDLAKCFIVGICEKWLPKPNVGKLSADRLLPSYQQFAKTKSWLYIFCSAGASPKLWSSNLEGHTFLLNLLYISGAVWRNKMKVTVLCYWQFTDMVQTDHWQLANCRLTAGLYFGQNLSANSWLSVGWQTANSRPTVSRQTDDRQPTESRQTADRQLTESRQVVLGAVLYNYLIFLTRPCKDPLKDSCKILKVPWSCAASSQRF